MKKRKAKKKVLTGSLLLFLLLILSISAPIVCRNSLSEQVIKEFSGGESTRFLSFDETGGTELVTFDVLNSTHLVSSSVSISIVPDRNLTVSNIYSGEVKCCAVSRSDPDNLLDLAIGTPNNQDNSLYRNIGDGSFSKTNAFSSFEVNDLEWADYDGDGDLDLALACAGQDALFTSDGEIYLTSYLFNSGPTQCLTWGDPNRDGLLDLAVGTNGQNRLYINNGSGFEGSSQFGSGDTEDMIWLDYDLDGDEDLAVANNDGASYIFQNIDGTVFNSVELYSQPYGSSLTALRSNADAYPDIYMGTFDPIQSLTGVNDVLLVNNNGASFTPQVQVERSQTLSCWSCDLDNDGNEDIILGRDGSFPSGTGFALGNGSFSFHPFSFSGISDCTGADLDLDGDQDILVVGASIGLRVMWSQARLHDEVALRFAGDPTPFVEFPTPFVPWNVMKKFERGNTTCGVWEDFNNDGRLDLALGNLGGQNLLYENLGDGNFIKKNQFGIGDTMVLASGDHDGDGDIDIAVGNRGQNFLYLNQAGSFSPQLRFGMGQTVGMDWCDLDNDGWLDLAVINAGSVNKIYLNQHDGTFSEVQGIGSGASSSFCIADFNNDGAEDIALGKALFEQNQLLINDGHGQFEIYSRFDNKPVTSMVSGDFDNDGFYDLAVSYNDHSNKIYLNNKDLTFQVLDELGQRNAMHMVAEDIDLDGDRDVILANWGGRNELFLNNGDSSFEKDLDLGSNNSWWVDMGDLNGDGWGDIVFCNDGENELIFNSGSTMVVKDFHNPVNDFLDENEPDQAGHISVPMEFQCQSKAQIIIKELSLEYSSSPQCSQIPAEILIDEDTLNLYLLDLRTYFNDDIDLSSELKYMVELNSQEDILNISIHENYWLSADALTGSTNDNWTGETSVKVQARDSSNLTCSSNIFTLKVRNIPDEPMTNAPVPDVMIQEGSVYNIDLSSAGFFIDGDGDALFYDVLVDPLNSQLNENISATIVEDSLYIKGSKNGTDYRVPVWLFCDDDWEVDTCVNCNQFVYQEFFVTVDNINDPPQWKPIPDVSILEDEPAFNRLDLMDYVLDSDNQPHELVIDLLDYNNSDNLDLTLDPGDWNLDIWNLKKDFVGISYVQVSVSDHQYSVNTTFRVVVLPMNDPPVTNLLSPRDSGVISSNSVTLIWDSMDPDGDNLTYDIYFSKKASGDPFYKLHWPQNTISIDNLEDGAVYYWMVLPDDGNLKGECLQEAFSLVVDTQVDHPTTRLLSPMHGSTIRSPTVTLKWEMEYEFPNQVKYDVYFYTDPSSPKKVLENHPNDTFSMEGLKNGEEYYWKVIPWAQQILGECLSQTWSFKVNLDTSQEFNARVLFEDGHKPLETVELRNGEVNFLNLTVVNIGNSLDTIEIIAHGESDLKQMIYFDPEIIDLEGYMSLNDRRTVRVIIDLTGDASDLVEHQSVVFSVRSSNGNITGSLMVDFIIIQSSKEEKKEAGGNNYFFVVFIVVLLIALTMVLTIVALRRVQKKKMKRGPKGKSYGVKRDHSKIEKTRAYRRRQAGPGKLEMYGDDELGIDTDGKKPNLSPLRETKPLSNFNTNEFEDLPYDDFVQNDLLSSYRWHQQPTHSEFDNPPSVPFPFGSSPSSSSPPSSQYDPEIPFHSSYPERRAQFQAQPSEPDWQFQAEEAVKPLQAIITEAHQMGADTKDARDLMDKIQDLFEKTKDCHSTAKNIKYYKKILKYSNATVWAVNRAVSRYRRKKQ